MRHNFMDVELACAQLRLNSRKILKVQRKFPPQITKEVKEVSTEFHNGIDLLLDLLQQIRDSRDNFQTHFGTRELQVADAGASTS